MKDWNIGDWCWHTRRASPCQVIDRETLWGEVLFRVWLPAKDVGERARARDLGELSAVRLTVEQILLAAAAAKLLDALKDMLMLRIGQPGGTPA